MLAWLVQQGAGTGGGDGVPWETILNVGVSPVVVLLLVLSRRLWTDGAYQAQVKRAEDAEARADRNEGKVDEMVALFRNEVTPALVTATTTSAEGQKLIQRIADRLGP